MNIFRNLFGGGRSAGGDKRGFYVYVQPHRCDEVIEVRIDLLAELSESDEGGLICRKMVRGERCPFPAEITLYFDQHRRLIREEIDRGRILSPDEYEAWLSQRDDPA